MTGIDVTLSKSDDGAGFFHDLRYTNDRDNGNGNASMLEITNQSGNELFAEICLEEQNEHGNWEYKWYPVERGQGLAGVRIRITGAWENSEFLEMLRLILEAEKMVDIVKP
jgi:hypothetical protein